MVITTRFEIQEKKTVNQWAGASTLDDGNAQLVVYVSINGRENHNYVALSGPKADIEEFVRGEIDEEEISHRWFAKARARG